MTHERGGERRVRRVLLSCSIDAGEGGVQVMFRDLVRSLEARGIEVDLIYAAPVRRPRLHEARNSWGRLAFFCPMPAVVRKSTLVNLAALAVFVPVSSLQLALLVRRRHIDAVNAHFLAPSFAYLALAAWVARVPFVLSVHGADLDSLDAADALSRRLAGFIVRASHRVVACSAALARDATRRFPGAAARTCHVHNGLDLSRYQHDGGPPPPREPYILSVCRHVHKKGVDTLLHAFSLVARTDHEVRLVLAGSGPLLDAHQALARDLGLGHRVRFLGAVVHDEISALFRGCTVYVLPSRAEPFGLVLLEAALHGAPVVATRVGGVTEIVEHETNGLLVEPDDPEAMAKAIARLLSSSALRERLAARAREVLMTRFLWKDRVEDYIRVFEGRAGDTSSQSGTGLVRTEVPHGNSTSST